ncbi:MAG TPA: M1 family metallopeptidase [Candidatus Saccharimonadales bacterium]|nr:M1 family metallopeptidase [Candidatus Saccharimonadales bacterium]
MGKSVKRLYNDIKPGHYDLGLKINSEKMTFSGSVKLTFEKTGRPSRRVTLHQKDLKITGAKLKNISKDKDINITRINTHGSLDEVRLHAEEMVYPGSYEAEISFSGKITDPMHGLYPCYFEHEGKKKVMFATQFESHHAREVFPCVDEPEAKASFQLTLDTPAGLKVLSNTTPDKQTEKDGRLHTVFGKTPVMSSYLLAFIVGELHSVEAKSKNGVTMRTWATAAQPKKFLEYANKEAVKIIEFFAEYFQTPYPLEKCDQVALPDFESGAMENWGLITYREVALLADPDNRSLSGEQYVSMVVAHELSHQWFGNLVTMKWWDDLWLNESFASLMEHIALDAIHPDWHWWENYVISDVLVTANRDIYKDVQPVGVSVTHPDDIHTLFDPAIVYAKGGRLLKMMRESIGEKAFREGLKEYFKENAYKNATRHDLWKSLSKSSNMDVSALMTPWIEQSGMPVLRVSREKDKLELSQERFLLDGEDKSKTWPIPLLSDKPLGVDLLEKKTAELEAPGTVIFNTKGSGHFLVDYTDKSEKAALAEAIARRTLPTEGRIIRLNDIILLARRGDTSLIEALDIAKKCKDEPRDAVWNMISRVIGLAKMLVEGNEQTEQAIKDFRVSLTKDIYGRLGWQEKPDEDPNDTLLRQTALGLMLAGEDKEVINHCLELYRKTTDIADLPAEIRTIVLTAVARFGDGKEIDSLLDIYEQTPNADLKHSISSSVAEVRDPKIGGKIIKRTISDGGIARPQDIFRWFAYLMRNRYTRHVAWDWLNNDWARIEKLFGGSKSMDYFPMYSAAPISTPAWQKKYKEFFTPLLKQRQLERNIRIGFSEIEARVEWRRREEPGLKKYFRT